MRSSSRSIISKLVEYWTSLVPLNPSRHERGFLGSVPYVLILRYFISFALVIRFLLHRPQYSKPEWSHILTISTMIIMASALATFATINGRMRRLQLLQAAFVFADIMFISDAYYRTTNPESDFFLFYYLPIFGAVEYLNKKWIIFTLAAIGCAMAFVVFHMPITAPIPWTFGGMLFRVPIPRWVFFVAVVLSSAFVFRVLSRRQVELGSLLNALHSASAEANPKASALDGIVEAILSEITGQMKFEFATVSLVDEYRDCIETVRGRNVPLDGYDGRSTNSVLKISKPVL